MLCLSWFTRRRLGDEACWDFGCPSFHDQKISKGVREEEERKNGRGAGQQPAVAAIAAGSGAGAQLRTCSCQFQHGGAASDLSEGTERWGKAREAAGRRSCRRQHHIKRTRFSDKQVAEREGGRASDKLRSCQGRGIWADWWAGPSPFLLLLPSSLFFYLCLPSCCVFAVSYIVW